MRLRRIGSGLCGAGGEADQVFGQFRERGEHLTGGRNSDEQPLWQISFQMGGGVGPIELVAFRNIVESGGDQHRQGVEVVGEYLSPEILLGRQPGQAGGIFQWHAMFQPLEIFFDKPTAVIQVGEAPGGIGDSVEQRRDHRMHAAVGGDHADQSYLGRGRSAFAIFAVRLVRFGQRHNRLRQIGTQEGFDRVETGIVGTHTEGNAVLGKVRNQPAGGIAAIQEQQIARREVFQILEQYLSLARRRPLQLGCQSHLSAWQVEGEGDGDGFPDQQAGGVLRNICILAASPATTRSPCLRGTGSLAATSSSRQALSASKAW